MKTVQLSLSSEVYALLERALEARGKPPSDSNILEYVLEALTGRLAKEPKRRPGKA
jgi:hypothetical protein